MIKIPLIALLLLCAFYGWRQRTISPVIGLLTPMICAVGIALVIMLEWSTGIARLLGVGRGADLILYVWTAISILLLTLIGGSSLLGPLAIILGQAGMQGQRIPPLAAAEALAAARTTAGVMSLGLGIGVLAAALGGMVGAKLWPSPTAPREHVTTRG